MGNQSSDNRNSNTGKDGIRDRNVLMVGPNFRVGKKIGCGNFGELRLGKTFVKILNSFPKLPLVKCDVSDFFAKNRNFEQKLKFRPKIENFKKHRNFDQKSKF